MRNNCGWVIVAATTVMDPIVAFSEVGSLDMDNIPDNLRWRVAKPSSYWIDDDLRLGVSKPEGCFCDRCLAAFNAATGLDLSRAELARRLYDTAVVQDPVRALWCAFNAESLALYASAVRQAADALGSRCRLGYQAVSADRIYTAPDYRPLLEALSGPGRVPVGIRPGHGFYTEAEPRGMVAKCLAIAREAERCRDLILPAAEGGDVMPEGRFHVADGDSLVASVCYEEENYPRRVLHKSPGAIMTECALALASGCDSLSLYWFSALQREPVEEYDRFLTALLRARPYFERLAASTRRTRLGGLARYVGAAAAQTADYDLYDPTDFDLACAGIPVTVAGPAASAWYLTEKSRRELPPERGTVGTLPTAIVDVADIGKYPTASRRRTLLDDLDAATGGAFPVRIDECRPLRILPRIREDGSLDSVTLLNLSIGDTDAFAVRVRRPGGGGGVLRDPKGRETPFALAPGASAEEGVARIENLPGWGVATLFFDESAPLVARPLPGGRGGHGNDA